MAPSHYLIQCWFIISEVLWHSPECKFTASAQATILHNELKIILLELLQHLPGVSESSQRLVYGLQLNLNPTTSVQILRIWPEVVGFRFNNTPYASEVCQETLSSIKFQPQPMSATLLQRIIPGWQKDSYQSCSISGEWMAIPSAEHPPSRFAPVLMSNMNRM